MRIKVGTALEERLVSQLKHQAVHEHRPVNELLEDAVAAYLHAGARRRELQRQAVTRLCSRPFRLAVAEVREILDEDYYEQ